MKIPKPVIIRTAAKPKQALSHEASDFTLVGSMADSSEKREIRGVSLGVSTFYGDVRFCKNSTESMACVGSSVVTGNSGIGCT